MKLRKIVSVLCASAIVCSLNAIPAEVSASENTVVYNVTGVAGVADGVVTVTAENPENVTDVKLWWGKSSSEKLGEYKAIKNYTAAEVTDPKEDALVFTDNSFTYEMNGNRLLPEGATHLIAEITTSDGAVELVSSEIPESSRFVAGDFLYSIVVISDFHANYETPFPNSRQELVLKKIQKYYDDSERKPQALIINGDIAESSQDYEYHNLENVVCEQIKTMPVYYNTGNHDTTMIYGFDPCKEAFEVHFENLKKQGYDVTRYDKWSYDVRIGGQHHIILAYPYADKAGFLPEQKKWLEDKIAEGEKSGEPTFLYMHFPVLNTVWRSTKSANAVDDTDFLAIMERHPGLIVFTSHLHNEPDSVAVNYVVNENTASYIDTGGTVYNVAPYGNDGKTMKTTGGSGRIVDVYKDKVVVRSRDWLNDKYNPRAECIIPNYGEKLNGDVTVFAENLNVGTEVKALVDGEMADSEKYNIEWYVGGVKQEEASNVFTITAGNENVSVKLTDKNNSSSYAWANTAIRELFVPEITEDDESGNEDEFDAVEITGADVEYYKDYMYVSGKFTASDYGKKVLLMVVPEKTYDNPETAVYINETTVGTDGSYSVKIKNDDWSIADDCVMIVKLDGSEAVASNIIKKADINEIVEITPSISAEGKVSLKLKNKYLGKNDNIQLIAAEYDENDRLVNTSVVTFNLAEGRQIQNASFNDALSSENKIKIFMWKNLVSATPMTGEAEISATK